nr:MULTISPECIES: hypothetical protein [Streptomyces violaceusniger group]
MSWADTGLRGLGQGGAQVGVDGCLIVGADGDVPVGADQGALAVGGGVRPPGVAAGVGDLAADGHGADRGVRWPGPYPESVEGPVTAALEVEQPHPPRWRSDSRTRRPSAPWQGASGARSPAIGPSASAGPAGASGPPR